MVLAQMLIFHVFVTGIRTNSTVAGQAWTRTSSNNNNVYNPNCKYSGYVYASASVGGTGCGSSHSDTGKIEHSFGLKGCTSSKVSKKLYIFIMIRYMAITAQRFPLIVNNRT